MGYRVCGETLHVYEKDRTLDIQTRKSIEMQFDGEVKFHSLDKVLTSHCAIRCGGEILNERIGVRGSLGMFGELCQGSDVVAITSGHLYRDGDIAKFQHPDTLKTIGRCIWPNGEVYENDRSIDNVHDISVITIERSALASLIRTIDILNEQVFVYDEPLSTLADRKVFKYGATTSETKGYVKKVSDFEMFGGHVMVILPSSAFDQFSDKGDSGSIVLTRVEDRLYAVGVVYGGELELLNAECLSAKKETIAASLKIALDRFTTKTGRSIKFDKM